MVIVGLLHVYRGVVSPWYGPTCRFYPSCSEYALVAVGRHGVLRGGWLATRRLLRCHPWNPGGVDLVPPARGEQSPSEDVPHPHHHQFHDRAQQDAAPLPSAPSDRRVA
jgi:hypothetical protein